MIREKLRTDSIDLLQFHVWDDSWASEPEFRETVEKLKSDGLIQFFGISINRWEPENGIAAHSHRPCRYGPGDLQHLRSGSRRQTFPRLQGAEYRRDRSGSA